MSHIHHPSNQYILSLIEYDKLNRIFNTKDIVHELMLNCNHKTLITLSMINKNCYDSYQNQLIWKIKLQEYTIYHINKPNHKREYDAIDDAVNLLKVVQFLRRPVHKHILICGDQGYSINISLYDLYWLNVDVSRKNMPMLGITLYGGIWELSIDEQQGDNRVIFYRQQLTINKCIQFFTLLFYHYPSIIIKMNHGAQIYPKSKELGYTILGYWHSVYGLG